MSIRDGQLLRHPAAAHTVECDEPGCPCLGFAPVLNEHGEECSPVCPPMVFDSWDDLIYAGFPKEGGHILGVAKRDIPPGGSLTIILDPKGGINYADPRCDLAAPPVAEGPYFGIDVSESTDVSAAVLFNRETGEFAATGGAYGFIERPMYAVQGGVTFGDPFKDITARATHTIADLSKKEWKP